MRIIIRRDFKKKCAKFYDSAMKASHKLKDHHQMKGTMIIVLEINTSVMNVKEISKQPRN